MAKNPLVRSYPRRVNKPLPNKSAGILDDYAVRKVIMTKEGTITKTPVNDNDIANKKYVDDNIGGGGLWSRAGTVLSPTTAGDDISLQFGDLVSEANPDGGNAIRIKATSRDVDVVIGNAAGFFTVWSVTDGSGIDALFDVNNDGNATIKGNITIGGTVDGIDIATDVAANTTHRGDVTGDPHNIEADTLTFTNKTLNSSTNDVHADSIHELLRNETGSTINRGDAVYISGFSVGQVIALVTLADASVPGTMPSVALVEDASIANNATGEFVEQGTLKDVDTNSWEVGDDLYVSTTGTTTNTLTNVRPTGAADQIQKVGTVLRKHASNGIIEVFGAGRSNDIPNTSTTGLIISADNSSADTQYTAQVLYNTDATPPTANTVPIGSIYIQYTA